MQQGGDVTHQNAPSILSDMKAGQHPAVTEKVSHIVGNGRTNIFPSLFLAYTSMWSSAGGSGQGQGPSGSRSCGDGPRWDTLQ